jgi:hypothetical protein
MIPSYSVNKLRLLISLYPEYNLKISCFLAHHAISWTGEKQGQNQGSWFIKKNSWKTGPYAGFWVFF